MKSFFNCINRLFPTPKTGRIKKTNIGKASKGFDFLGKRILPIGILPSASALSRMQRNTVRLYEQGATKQRIVRYWMKWLCWVSVLLGPTASLASTNAYVGATCPAITDSNPAESTSGDHVAAWLLEPGAFTCRASAGIYSLARGASAFDLLLALNSHNDGTPVSVNTFTISYVAGFTDVRLDGSAFASGDVKLVNVEDSLRSTLCFTYGGVEHGVVIKKDANTHTLSETSIVAGSTLSACSTDDGDDSDSGIGTAYVLPPENPGVFGGDLFTPTVYKLTVSKIEFKDAQGVIVPLAEGGSTYDVAGVDSNTSVGSFGKSNDLPSGTYTEIRVMLSGNLEISVSGSDKGVSCRTDSGGSTGAVSSTLDNVGIGANDGGTATPQSVSFPTGATADAVLNNAGITRSGNDFIFTAPVNFSIEEGNVLPTIAIDIDVKHAVEVLTANGNCNILPQPPSVNIKVGS